MNFLIAYDIFDTKRRIKVRKRVYSYAMNGQKSAREASLNKNDMNSLMCFLLQETKSKDKINIIKYYSKPILLGKSNSIQNLNNGIIIL